MSQSYQVKVIDSLGALAQMSKPWNDLLNESRSSTIFLTWEWIYTWAECFLGSDRRLFVLAVFKDKELVGIAPWCIQDIKGWSISLKQMEFLGTPEIGSEYLDVFLKQGKEKEVVRSLYRFLFQEASSHWDCILLSDIPSESRFLQHFLQQIEDEGKYVEVQLASFCPRVVLPSSRQEFLEQLSSNRREQYLRHLRLLKKKGSVAHRSLHDLDVERSLEAFNFLYQGRWEHSDRVLAFIQKVVSFCSGRDWLQVDLLSVNGKDIAGLFHLRHQDTLSMFLMAVDHSFDKKISVGNILVGLSIEKAIADGLVVYDFLKGPEDYKFHWANSARRSLHLIFYAKKVRPLMWMAGRSLKSMAKALVR